MKYLIPKKMNHNYVRTEEYNLLQNYLMTQKDGVVKYHIFNFLPLKINKLLQIPITERCFNRWGEHLGLTFQRTHDFDESDIKIFWYTKGVESMVSYEGFDGLNGTLARALITSPDNKNYFGHIHFDISENWTTSEVPPSLGTDYESVLMHEIGHTLGVAHSEVKESIMYPAYKYRRDLSEDDIRACVELRSKYGTSKEVDVAELQRHLNQAGELLHKVHNELNNL